MIIKKLLGIGSFCCILLACGTQKNDAEVSATANDTVAVQEASEPTVSAGVSIWDKVSVRATPSGEGKWLTSLSLGESLTFLNEEGTDEDGKIYYKIRLNDGKEGWVRSEFIVTDGKAAVFINDSDLYSRPDLLTKSSNKFSKMDIIAVKQTQDDWVEVTGKRSEGKWIDSGWIKASNISFEPVDIAMAKFAKPAIEEADINSREEKLEEILANVDLSSSVFVPDVKDALDQIKMSEDVPSADENTPEEDSEIEYVEEEPADSEIE